MAILWQSSLVPFTDPNGAPYSGAKAFFFDATTTTPRIVYRNSGLDNPHDHPVIANSAGMFPAVFLNAGDYRLRIETADGVTIWDVDGISPPAPAIITPPDTGDTDITLLARTGDLKARYGVGTHSGWVRLNGRTIGSALSGATERANADCEALFLYLWTADADLAVSGGRGASAAGDWAADKRIDLPSGRGMTLVGLDGMGSTRANVLPDSVVAGGETGDTLGAMAGSSEVTLTTAQMPTHNHGGATGSGGVHAHNYQDYVTSGVGDIQAGAGYSRFGGQTRSTENSVAHNHSISNEGGGQAHPNVQASLLVTFYIKL